MQPNELPPNHFKLTFDVMTKADKRPDVFTKEVGGKTKRFVRGRASGTGLDLETEKMARSAIVAMRNAVLDGIWLPDGTYSRVPLQAGHRADWLGDTLGWLVDAEIDGETFDLFITAELDDDNTDADTLWRKLTREPEHGKPFKAGLSVGGLVVSAGQEWDDAVGLFVRVFYEVALKEVSVVSSPAYPTAYLAAMAKSVDWNKVRGRTVLVSEDQIMSELFPTTDAETTEKSVEESDVATETATATDTEVEKTEEVAEETEVEKTETVEESATEEVEKAEAEVVENGEEPEAEVEKSTNPLAELQDQIASLTARIADMASAMNALMTKATATEEVAEVEKAAEPQQEQVETDAPVVEVEKAVETEETADVAKGLGFTLTELAEVVKGAIADAVAPLETRLKELEEEEIDKSFSVTTAKNAAQQQESPLERYERESAEVSGKDALKLAISHGFQRA